MIAAALLRPLFPSALLQNSASREILLLIFSEFVMLKFKGLRCHLQARKGNSKFYYKFKR
ncbi:MAG: hypothetical protein APZ16_04335 [Candidatus Hadarchaeum yellowstonense]|uniref:Uncharacterized protein n=1 Tax=Hadarchaeum yellowstonense TaxID=1776334 RepID=A0A147K136_HADYE|nr:MAG: hypothetical protein APZ16_04335 [Candidatus Hadarchaeum yellowstonense]